MSQAHGPRIQSQSDQRKAWMAITSSIPYLVLAELQPGHLLLQLHQHALLCVCVCVYTRMSDREDAPSRTRQDQQTQQTDHHPRPTALERTVGLVRSLHPLLRVLLPRGVLACAMCTRACVSNVFDHGPPSPPPSHPPIHLPTHPQTHALTPAQQVNRRLHAPRLLHARHGPVRVRLQRGQVVLAQLLVVRPGRRLLLGRLPMVAMGGGG